MNLSPQMQKMAIAAVLFVAWSYLVYTGKAPTGEYIENIKSGLGALGLYHIFKGDTSKAAAPPKDTP